MTGPNNWPNAKPAVIRARTIVALASARALVSCIATIVTTIKVAPTKMAAMEMLAMEPQTTGSNTPIAIKK